jgi:hypothetical protein
VTVVQYEDFELADGHYEFEDPPRTLRIWSQSEGQWACVAYDHGPFCRRCQKLDPTAAACLAVVLERHMDVFDDPTRGMVFQVNEAGKVRVETAIRLGGFAKGIDS